MAAETDALTGNPEVPLIEESVKESLADKIQSKFDAVMNTDESDDTPAEEPDAETPAEPAADAALAEPADKVEEPEAEETPAEAVPAKAQPFPAAYRRSLKAYDWTDEEINEAAKQPGFLTTAAKIHQNRNKEVSGWAEAGRKAQQSSQAPKPEPAVAATGLTPIDAAKLKAQYGDEALIDALVGPVNLAIERMNQMLPVVQQTQQRAQMAHGETLVRQIDGFFSGKGMESYKETYGTDTATLTGEQLAGRNKVLEFADALTAGAQLQGRTLPLNDAMQLAFDAVSGGTKTQAARKELTKSLQTRAKGVTLKPGSRGTNLNASPAKGRSDLEKRVKSSLSAVLG
jgi:hypothetical protein